MRHVDTIVIGGGPSGLAFAYEFQGDTLVLEKEDRVGGLCRSVYHDGGVFDVGGHSFHTPHPEVFELVNRLLPLGLEFQQRDARVFSHGHLIPYPFQKFYDRLPDAAVVRECDEGLRGAAGNAEAAVNFEEYIVRKFGAGIAKHFMLPYNRKLWARDVSRISCEWTAERVAGPKGQKEEFDTRGGRRKPLQPDTQVGYPRKGGFEEIFKGFVPHIPGLELGSSVISIDPVERTLKTGSGREYSWHRLVSTIPLPLLVRMVAGTPMRIIEAADRLEYMSLTVLMILVGRRLKTPVQRIYVADPKVPPHKIALNHNSSDALRKRDRHAIMAEVSLAPHKKSDRDVLLAQTIRFLCDIQILPSTQDICWTGSVDVHYAYPVYTPERPSLLQEIKSWLSGSHILTLGRFGDWEYVNSDRCVMKALQLARKIRGETPTPPADIS